MHRIESIFLPKRVARREAERLEEERKEIAEQELIEKRRQLTRTAEADAGDYLNDLPPLPGQTPIVTINEELSTAVQIYEVERSRKLALIVPGSGSTGQKPKYDMLISDLTQQGVSVVRANNVHQVDSHGRLETKAYQNAYLQYMTDHLETIASFLNENGVIDETKEVHLIGTCAGASAILALPHLLEPEPRSLLLLGPSGDVNVENIAPSLSNYLNGGGRVHVLSGEFDGFRRGDPYVSLKKLSNQHGWRDQVFVTTAKGGSHTLDNDRSTVQLAVHRESLRALDLPYEHLDEICGDYPYITFDD